MVGERNERNTSYTAVVKYSISEFHPSNGGVPLLWGGGPQVPATAPVQSWLQSEGPQGGGEVTERLGHVQDSHHSQGPHLCQVNSQQKRKY